MLSLEDLEVIKTKGLFDKRTSVVFLPVAIRFDQLQAALKPILGYCFDLIQTSFCFLIKC